MTCKVLGDYRIIFWVIALTRKSYADDDADGQIATTYACVAFANKLKMKKLRIF